MEKQALLRRGEHSVSELLHGLAHEHQVGVEGAGTGAHSIHILSRACKVHCQVGSPIIEYLNLHLPLN